MSDQVVSEEPAATPMAAYTPIEATAYGPDGKLTREGMVAIIRAGGSVLYGSAHIWREQDLPTELQLAEGDARKQAAARQSIQDQINSLQAQLAGSGPAPEGTHPGDTGVPFSSTPDYAATGVAVGRVGEGDTAGADGDLGDPNSLASQNARAAAEQKAEADKAAADQAKAEAEARIEADAAAAKAARSKKNE